jgi:hypothetical protein
MPEAKIVNGEDGELQLENFYTPLAEAKEEIQRRWNDKDLRKKVEEYLGEIPIVFQDELQAVLFRNIATPDFEFQQARNKALDLGIKPLYLEYLDDKFCTRSLDKLYLGKMAFFHCRDANGDCVVSRRTLFDLKENDGKLFKKVMTRDNGNLIDFHHNLFKPLYPDVGMYDISVWIKKKGKNAFENYPYFLSLFLCNGILLEAFNLNSAEELNFIGDVILPAYNRVVGIFGIKPIIVKLFNGEEMRDLFWYCHPQFLLQYIDKNKT